MPVWLHEATCCALLHASASPITLLPSLNHPSTPPAPPASRQAMRIQSRHWECMRQLVQQQFKVLAAAAARQEALAAMKMRREALGGAASSGEGLGDGECEEEAEEAEGDEEMSGGEEEAAEAHVHRRPPPGLDGDDAETDTPHQREGTSCLSACGGWLACAFTALLVLSGLHSTVPLYAS